MSALKPQYERAHIYEAMFISSGPITAYLTDLIARQVEEAGLVVWFDPERDYETLAATVEIPDCTVLRYEGSFFALRHTADTHMEGERPRLLVYVPLTEEATANALAELTAPGAVMKPGSPSRNRNTRLAVVARAALGPYYSQGDLSNIVRGIEEGRLTYDDVDGTPSQGSMILARVFETAEPQEVALRFLDSDRYDSELLKRGGSEDLQALLSGTYGLPAPPDDTTAALRAHLARHALATEFLAKLHGDAPAPVAKMGAHDSVQRSASIVLVESWRRDRRRRESYADWATRVESDLDIRALGLDAGLVRDVETFSAVDELLQDAIERGLAGDPDLSSDLAASYGSIVAARLQDFWSAWPERFDEIQPRWQIIQSVLDVLASADRVEAAIRPAPTEPETLLRRYAEGDEPWCLLDTHFRGLEQLVHTFDLVHRHPNLAAAVHRARRRYMAVGGDLAERFSHALQDARFRLGSVLEQREIFSRRVAPLVSDGKTAYVLVDALRFEMAREQAGRLSREYDVMLEVAAATPPTITPVGMAALLPGAENGVGVTPAGAGAVAVQIGGSTLASRRDRIEHFSRVVPGTVAVTLEDLLTTRSKTFEARLRDASILLVTSQEIDALAEGDNILQAWYLMAHVLEQIGRLVNRLRDIGCRTIIITADHGYLFAEELEEDMKISAPGGETVDLHRRVWIGRGGAADPAYLRTPLSAAEVDGGLDMAVPWGFAIFKSPGGARAYFHGGLAPQEVAIPVLTLRPRAGAARAAAADVEWRVSLGSGKITTRFCAVTVAGQATGLMIAEPPVVRLEVRAEGQVLSSPVSATYGFSEATGDIRLRLAEGDPRSIDPDTVTLMIGAVPGGARSASIHLLDAVTGRELARPVAVALSIQEY